jgi:hypothetical protein
MEESDTRGERPDLAADLRVLGENLKEALRAAWQSAERERLQAEIERGLASLGRSVSETFEEGTRDLKNREKVRERVQQARERVAQARDHLRTGAAGDRVRVEIHDLLTRLNDELARSKERWTPGSGPRDGRP